MKVGILSHYVLRLISFHYDIVVFQSIRAMYLVQLLPTAETSLRYRATISSDDFPKNSTFSLIAIGQVIVHPKSIQSVRYNHNIPLSLSQAF